ncbi:universal stress protein [Chitinolyticbacter meiyuanensis]|uniref:universal stress protein n=1 Tax=Chitinolyticbacter meiyuanensis TaxID=682798 RepID=UPI0011E5AACF|nr:universal stress protein [Chitinolyticbacter meiyuanensis]
MIRILLAVDQSDCALRAVEHVIDLAHSGQALSVHVLNVQQPMRSKLSLNRIVSQSTLDRHFLDLGEQALAPAIELLRAARVQATGSVAFGQPAPAIVEHARQGAYDLLVLGCQGQGAWQHFMLGSTAYQVAHLTPCPITLVK